jgi:uncharacterized protein
VGSIALETVVPPALLEQVLLLGERYGVRNIRVFGSFARGEAESDSDLDLLVDYVGASGFDFVRFADAVEDLLGRKVDVVTEKSVHPLVRDKVLAQAIPLR